MKCHDATSVPPKVSDVDPWHCRDQGPKLFQMLAEVGVGAAGLTAV